VAVGQVESSAHTDSDEAIVGLKGSSVLASEVELVGDGVASARAGEVAHVEDSTQLFEDFRLADGLDIHFHFLSDYITKITLFRLTAVSSALKERKLHTALGVNLVEFRQRQTAIVFIVGVHEHTEIVILKVFQLGFLFLGKEFGVVLFLGLGVVAVVPHNITKVTHFPQTPASVAQPGQPRFPLSGVSAT
jgi:hypothetical protein